MPLLLLPQSAASTGVTGTLAATEAQDGFAGAGRLGVTGTLGATEAKDVLAGSGSSAPPGVSGTLAATEAADALAGSGSVTSNATGTLAATEAPDTFQGFGDNGVIVAPPLGGAQGGGGGGRTAKVERWDRDELVAIYDRLLGIEQPTPVVRKAIKAVERVAEEQRPEPIAVDWDAVSVDVRAVKALVAAYEAQQIEDDDEDAITALFLLLEAA